MMKFKESPVIFDEDSHSYHLDGKRLLGITGLIHSILGLGVYPDANEHVKDFIIREPEAVAPPFTTQFRPTTSSASSRLLK